MGSDETDSCIKRICLGIAPVEWICFLFASLSVKTMHILNTDTHIKQSVQHKALWKQRQRQKGRRVFKSVVDWTKRTRTSSFRSSALHTLSAWKSSWKHAMWKGRCDCGPSGFSFLTQLNEDRWYYRQLLTFFPPSLLITFTL